MSFTRIKYNGVTLEQVRISEYRIDNGASPDSPQSTCLRHKLTGEAIVFDHPSSGGTSGSSSRNFQKDIINRLNVPRQSLYIATDTNDSGSSDPSKTWVIAGPPKQGNGSAYPDGGFYVRDEEWGPYVNASIVGITGTAACIVNFTIEWSDSSTTDTVGTINFRSFYMSSSFSIDEMGMTTIRKTGSVVLTAPEFNHDVSGIRPVRQPRDIAGASDTALVSNGIPTYVLGDGLRTDLLLTTIQNMFDVGYVKFPDQLRTLVSGNLAAGFRRIRQEYAIDETGRRMIFDVTDQEFVRGLPAPARVGNCQFTYERSIDDSSNAIGTKHFIASVKGGAEVSIWDLLILCIRMSQNRIYYDKDLIVKIRVTEENMLSENALTFEIVAKAAEPISYTPSATGSAPNGTTPLLPGQSSGNSQASTPGGVLLRNILSPISLPQGVFRFVPATMPETYGNCRIMRLHAVPMIWQESTIHNGHFDSYQLEPTTKRLGDAEIPYPVVYLFPTATFPFDSTVPADTLNRYVAGTSPQVPAGPNRGDLNQGNDKGKNHPLRAKGGRSISVKSNIISCPSVCREGRTAIFQVAPPLAYFTDMSEGSKMNEAPTKSFSDMPTGASMMSMDMSFTSGNADRNGNRVYSANYVKQMVVGAPGDLPQTSTGSSPTNPSYSVQLRNVSEGVSLMLAEFYPNSVSLPPDESQGNADGYSNPPYTPGLGTSERYA